MHVTGFVIKKFKIFQV